VVITTGGHVELEAPMTGSERDSDRRAEVARDIALFRYALIRQAADPALSTKQRGQLVRALAASEHTGPFGRPVRYSRESLDRWIRAWKAGGFEALQPTARHLEPRTEAAVLELAAGLKREVPARTAAQVAAILRAHAGDATTVPSARTLQRHFAGWSFTPVRTDGRPAASSRTSRLIERPSATVTATRIYRKVPCGPYVRGSTPGLTVMTLS
jgi:putative transposase